MSGKLIAYEYHHNPGFVLEPASPRRDWMDEFPFRAPYRCLPLVMANQAGWVIRTPVAFTVTWKGKPGLASLTIDYPEPFTDPFLQKSMERCISSHFGGGIFTINFPWLFRTEKGIGMWVHGPANEPRHNAHALEGIVETDWAHSTFTMNWQVTKRQGPVYFKKGDTVCVLTPFPLDLLESLRPEIRSMSEEPELLKKLEAAAIERQQTLAQYQPLLETEERFELNYMRGETRDQARRAEGHRTNFKLAEFSDQRTTR